MPMQANSPTKTHPIVVGPISQEEAEKLQSTFDSDLGICAICGHAKEGHTDQEASVCVRRQIARILGPNVEVVGP